MSVFQPTLGSGVFSEPGADVTRIFGQPNTAASTTGSGIPQPQHKLGTVMSSDQGGEFIFCRFTLGALTDLVTGLAWQLDKDFTASLISTANAVIGQDVVFNQFWAPQTPPPATGTYYYAWFGRAGHLAVQTAAGSVAAGVGETTATAGQLKLPGTPTSGSKGVVPTGLYAVNKTFTGNSTLNPNTISGVTDVNDLCIGAVLSPAPNFPANPVISNIRRAGGSYQVDLVQSGNLTAPALATLSATGSSFTATVTLNVQVDWPTVARANP